MVWRMAAKTEQIDCADPLDRLNDVRLDRDWSYRQLADDITRVTGFAISAATLQPLLGVPRRDRPKPFDRTLHKIRRYLETLPAAAAKQPRKPKGRAA